MQGDSCCKPNGLGNLSSLLQEWIPDTFVYSVRLNEDPDEDIKASYFGIIQNQASL